MKDRDKVKVGDKVVYCDPNQSYACAGAKYGMIGEVVQTAGGLRLGAIFNPGLSGGVLGEGLWSFYGDDPTFWKKLA